MRMTVLGTRGSVPVSGACYEEFGGATSCYLVEADGQAIILDAGSGIVRAPCAFDAPPSILLSHLHLDHLVGLGMYGRLAMPGAQTRIYVPGVDAGGREAFARVFSPPLWPLGLADYGGDVVVRDLPDTLRVGDVLVRSVEGSHPGGSRLIKVECQGKALVYATDYECEPTSFDRLVELCHGADLVLFDAQYDDAELAARKGFGHSSQRGAVELMERSGARRMLLIHHDPNSDDDTLRDREHGLGRTDMRYAREGEVVEL